jgi:hypothetical protein
MLTYPKDKALLQAFSYDAMCIWAVNLYWRFIQNFSDLLYLLLLISSSQLSMYVAIKNSASMSTVVHQEKKPGLQFTM